jgi:hypothetical protein
MSNRGCRMHVIISLGGIVVVGLYSLQLEVDEF